MNQSTSRSNLPPSGTILGPLSDIGSGGKEYVFGRGIGALRIFAIRMGGGAVAYVNRCSHYSLPLNHRPDEFLTRDGSRIMCRQHLALYDIADGSCIDGACEGEGLQPVAVAVVDGMLTLT